MDDYNKILEFTKNFIINNEYEKDCQIQIVKNEKNKEKLLYNIIIIINEKFQFKIINNDENDEFKYFKISIKLYSTDSKNWIKITQNRIHFQYNKNKPSLSFQSNININFPLNYLNSFLSIFKVFRNDFFSELIYNFSNISIPIISLVLYTNETTMLKKLKCIHLNFYKTELKQNEKNSREIKSIITFYLYNPLNQVRNKLCENLNIFIDLNNQILKFDNCHFMIAPLSINILDLIIHNILEQNNLNLIPIDIYPTLINCSSNVLCIKDLTSLQYLSPNNNTIVYYKDLEISLSISDTVYSNKIDISSLYQIYFNYLLDNKIEESKDENLFDYINIELLNENGTDKRNFILLFCLNKNNRIKITILIFENLIILHKYPNEKNILSYITKNYIKDNITSMNFSDYSEHNTLNNIIEYTNVSINLECLNTLLCNYLNYDIILEIKTEKNSDTIEIKSKNEYNINLETEPQKNISNDFFIYFNMDNIKYKSDNIYKYYRNMLIGSNFSKIFSVPFYNIKNQSNKINVNMQIEICFTSKKNTFSTISLFPHIIFRDFTSIPSKKINFYFSFLYNQSCEKINSNILSSGNNNEEFNIYHNTHKQIESNENLNNECAFVLNNLDDNKINLIKLCLVYNNVNGDSIIYISNTINIYDNSDYLIPLILYSDKLNNIFHYFIFRLNVRIIQDNLVTITISSFLNLYPHNLEISLKNKIELPKTNQNIFKEFLEYSNDENQNIDTIYSLKSLLNYTNPIIDINNDIISFYNFLKSIKQTIDIIIKKDYVISGIKFKDLYANEKFHLIGINKYNFENNKIISKLFKKRMLHNPYFICEINEDKTNLNISNTYIFIDNETNFSQGIYFHNKNSHDIHEYEIKIGTYEIFSINNNDTKNNECGIYTFILTIDKKDIDLIKNGIELYDEKKKEFNRIYYERKMNIIYIKLFNADKKPKKEEKDIEMNKNINDKSNVINYNFILNKLQIDFLFLPFFVNHQKSHKKMQLSFNTDKLLFSYSENKNIKTTYMNISLTNLSIIDKMKEKNNNNIFSTKFFTDIRLKSNEFFYNSNLTPNFSFPKYNNLILNLPYEMSINIDENLFQIFNFFFIQLNNNLLIYQKNQNQKTNILLFNTIILPKIQQKYIISSIKLNDFNMNISIEYKKGLDFTIKNSLIKSYKQEITNLLGTENEIFKLLKNNLMSSFFTNISSLFASTELFGNFNDLFNKIKSGYNKIWEKPFGIGIFNFFFDSFKGGFHSIIGIGKSLGKSIRNINGRDNMEFEIYRGYFDVIKREKIEKNKIKLKNISTFLRGLLLNENILNDNQLYLFDFSTIVKFNEKNTVFIMNKYFFCLCFQIDDYSLSCQYVFPFYNVVNLDIKKNNEVKIYLKKDNNKNIQKIKIEFNSSFDKDYFYNEFIYKCENEF